MKNWQSSRNYRRIRMADGTIKNIIIIDGMTVEVSNEVFLAYSQMERHERYLEELYFKIPHVSFEKLLEADVPIDVYMEKHSPSAEDIVLAAEEEVEYAEFLDLLTNSIAQLKEEDRSLITAIYFDCISLREYARRTGVTLRAIQKRRDRILKDLKKLLTVSKG